MLEKYEIDFGRDKKLTPQMVIRPTSIKDIQAVFKNSANSKIAVRGKAHSTGGQTLADKGIVVDMTTYSIIGPIVKLENERLAIEIQAGAIWKDVFNVCLDAGLMPPTYADWLDLTVGGTVSTGGVGQTTFKKGLQIDNVAKLELMTTQDTILICSAEQNKKIFDLARGGYGQFGVISRIWMYLEKAPKEVFVYKLLFLNLAEFLKVQSKLANFQQIDAIQSHIIVGDKQELRRRIGTHVVEQILENLPEQAYYFLLEITKYADNNFTLAGFEVFLKSVMQDEVLFILSERNEFKKHINRVPPLLANPMEQNLPKHHHCCFFMAANKAYVILEDILAKNEHSVAMGQGIILIIPMKRSKINAPYFILPEAEDIFFIAILRRHLLPCSFEKLIEINEQTYEQALKLGAKLYPVGSGEFLKSPDFWQVHYGQSYNEVIATKKNYDPNNCLTPAIKLF